MIYRYLTPFCLFALLLLSGCGGSSEVEFAPTATEAASPSPIVRATRSPVVLTPRPLGSPTRTTPTATPSGPPRTATATVEPTPSAALSRAARDLDDKLDDFRAAVRDGDSQRALSLQRELLAEVDKAEQTARADKTKYGEQMLAALATLRIGLTGDLPKLDAARVELRKIGGSAAAPAGTPGADATAQSIDSLEVFAGQLADKVANFQRALAKNDTAALLSIQEDILLDVERAETQLKDSRARQAELVRSALGDVRAGIAGEPNKLAMAESKLREAAGRSSQTTQTVTPAVTPAATATPQATPSVQPKANAQQLAGELRGGLDTYVRATQEPANQQNLDRTKRELQDQLGRAESAIRDDNSPPAARLRTALGLIRDVLGGDSAKVEPARRALEAVGS